MRIYIPLKISITAGPQPRHLQASQIRMFYFLANLGVLLGFLIEDSLDLDRMG